MKESKFKQTEVGMIPWDWEAKTLTNVANTASGGTPSRSNESFYKGSIKWFTTTELKDCELYDSFEHISEAAIECSSAKVFPKNTLLMAMYGATIGKLGLLKCDAATNQACCAIFPKKADVLYLYYFLLYNRDNIIAMGCGAGQPNVSQDIVKKINIPLPPTIEEQQRIANALSDVDSLISNLEKLIAKKKNIKQGAMQQLLTGRKRLPGFKEDWCEKQISKIGFTYTGLSGKTASDFNWGNALYVTFLNVLKNPIIDKHLFQKVNVCESENQNAVLKGDLLFNTSSEVPEEVGICSVLKDYIPNLYLNSFCFGFRLTDDEIEGLFLSYYFRSTLGRNLMSLLAQGSTRYNLSKDNFLKSKILMPSSKVEQTAIANVLSDMDSEIQTLETKLAKYRKLKTGMMQQLLTGKIRLI